MRTIDCAVFFEWEYDEDFISILAARLAARKVSYAVYRPGEFGSVGDDLKRNRIRFRTAIDRASDVDENCESIVKLAVERGVHVVNDPPKMEHSSDKASMHLEFITAGLYVPYTIIISPYSAEQEIRLSLNELARLGRPFIIKPANTTGGGIGVVTGAENLHDVIETRKHHAHDKYLLQQKIEPIVISGRRAWFRPFFVFDRVFVCWWDDTTHIYETATESELGSRELQEITGIMRKIRSVCGLDFFSTEVAATREGKFVVIDYVNEMCDMRLKSRHFDGVPDDVVGLIADRLAFSVKKLAGKAK